MGITRSLLLWGSENEWMREHVPRFRLVQKAVQRFMPGEDLETALAAAEEFEVEGISTVFTNLGENVDDLGEAIDVTRHYRHAVDEIADKGFDTEISIKLTHLGLCMDEEAACGNVVKLAEHAEERGSYLWIDMEGSAYTDRTLDVVERVLGVRSNVGVCLQAYLYRTAEDVERMLRAGAGIRLVKGAYDEPPDIAFPRKADVDENFFELSRHLLSPRSENAHRVAFATHDQALANRIRDEAESRGVSRDRYEFQMLYGIAPGFQKELNEDGFGIRVLISYGKAWFPWYMRRLAERPANVLFVLRNVVPG